MFQLSMIMAMGNNKNNNKKDNNEVIILSSDGKEMKQEL